MVPVRGVTDGSRPDGGTRPGPAGIALTAADRADLRAGLLAGETRLMERVLELAHQHGYTRYTSTLVEAWRMSIVGLTASVLVALDRSPEVPEMGPDDDVVADPLAAFGIEEARRHRSRGVNLAMFLSLFKYYRLAYEELVGDLGLEEPATARLFLARVFDRTELGYTTEWAGTPGESQIHELSRANLQATNDKTRMLTLVESLPLPAMLVDPTGRIDMANRFAAQLLGRDAVPGGEYYAGPRAEERPPWIREVIERFERRRISGEASTDAIGVTLDTAHGPRQFEAYVDLMQDISHKFVGYAVALLDVTQRHEDEFALRRASTVFTSTTNAILITDGEGTITQVNPAFTATFGWSEAEAAGVSADQLLGTSVWAAVAGEHDDVGRSGRWSGEATLTTAHGSAVTGWLSVSDVRNADGARDVIAVFTDVTPLKDSEARLDHLARHDPLTGLANRVVALEQLQLALRSAHRGRRAVAVLFLDLDRFKEINDSLGHSAGDQALQQVAERLSARLRSGDVLARLGGDEFLVVAEGLASIDEAEVVANKVLGALREPVSVDGREFVLTASIGISVFPGDAADADSLIRNADAAMYEAKEHGRNRARFYSPELTERASQRLLLESELRRAINADALSLDYQPIVALPEVRLARLEALLRWTSDRIGPVLPATFVPLIEDIGLMPEVGAWVLDRALGQLAQWRAAGVDIPGVSVNVSPAQIEQPGFIESVAELLARHRIPPEDLELEVTEGTVFRVRAHGAALLHHISDSGVRIAIDDFGAGYSSLARLEELPLDTLKIDRAFVSGLGPSSEGERRQAVMDALIDLAHAHRLRVTAEGIERPDELAALAHAGCEFAQGFLISMPVPASQVPDLVARISSLEAGPGA